MKKNQLAPLRKAAAAVAATATAALLSLPCLHAGTPLGGLTVAVSGDGTQLVAGGDTRTLLVLDPQTLEVKERHWVEIAITSMAFNKDGSLLAIQDTSDSIWFYSTADWSKKLELPKRSDMTVNGDLLAGHDGSYSGTNVFVHAFADGSNKASVSFPRGVRIAALALSDDGTKLAVLTAGSKDAEEKNVPYSQVPKDLRGLDLEEFKQKNDGQTSKLFIYEVASGKALSEASLYYSTSARTVLYFSGENVVVVNYSNVNATLTPEGGVTLFQLPNSYNYGFAVSADSSLVMSGGLADYSLTQAGTLTSVKGAIDKLPSWPEYWKAFSAVSGNGPVYGATSGYRIFQLDAAGKVVKSAPVK